MRPNITGCILAVSLIAQGSYAEKLNLSQTGHIKYQLTHTDYADNSIFAQLDHDKMTDQLASFRYNINAQNSHWQLDGHYEVGAVNGDTAALRSQSPEFGQRISLLPSDKNRLLNMTQTLHEGERSEVVHRIDRLSVGYQTERHVVKVGRQVISWGNGFFYAPMDFFNPFAPDAIDREYKTGDDLLYYQSSFKNGDDLQAVWVGRRDEHGDVTAKVDSVAAKYHGFWGNTEVDLLASQHFEDYILGTAADAKDGAGA